MNDNHVAHESQGENEPRAEPESGSHLAAKAVDAKVVKELFLQCFESGEAAHDALLEHAMMAVAQDLDILALAVSTNQMDPPCIERALIVAYNRLRAAKEMVAHLETRKAVTS